MKIAEVLLLEAYFDELELAVKDRLAQYLGSDVNEIPTEEFRKSNKVLKVYFIQKKANPVHPVKEEILLY